MLNFLRNRWFLIALVVLSSSGLTIGIQLSKEEAESFSSLINPRWITAFVLFLMAFSLDSRQLKASVRSPGPVLWASLVNYVVIPVLALCLVRWQSPDDFKYGLMIAASVPCTLAGASVWTRRAGGNDAVSLLVTLLTNAVCFLAAPFWLSQFASEDVQLNSRDMVFRLFLVVLIPTIIGQGLRQIVKLETVATQFKSTISVVAQSLILVLVLAATIKAGPRLNATGFNPGLAAVVLIWSTCIAIHLTAMFIGVAGALAFGFSRTDCAAVAFASSQKTLPIGIVLADEFANLGFTFALFPILMYHFSQIFIDTLIADRLASGMRSEAGLPS